MKKNVVSVIGKNYFNDDSFKEVCDELEKGNEVGVWIDCIGHTRAAIEGSIYTDEIRKKYGDRLEERKSDCLDTPYFKLKGVN